MTVPGRIATILAVAGAMAMAASRAEAALIVTITEVGSDVVASASGSINTAGLTAGGTLMIGGSNVNNGEVEATGPGGTNRVYSGISGPSSFGSSGFSIASSSSGSLIALDARNLQIDLPTDYVSGNSLTSTGTWAGKSIADLALTPGTYTWTWGSGQTADSYTLVITTAQAAPEPATLALLGAPFAAATLLRRRRVTSAS